MLRNLRRELETTDVQTRLEVRSPRLLHLSRREDRFHGLGHALQPADAIDEEVTETEVR